LIFLQHPEFKLAERLYIFVIRPIFKKYENDVDKYLSHFMFNVATTTKKIIEKGMYYLPTVLFFLQKSSEKAPEEENKDNKKKKN